MWFIQSSKRNCRHLTVVMVTKQSKIKTSIMLTTRTYYIPPGNDTEQSTLETSVCFDEQIRGETSKIIMWVTLRNKRWMQYHIGTTSSGNDTACPCLEDMLWHDVGHRRTRIMQLQSEGHWCRTFIINCIFLPANSITLPTSCRVCIYLIFLHCIAAAVADENYHCFVALGWIEKNLVLLIVGGWGKGQ